MNWQSLIEDDGMTTFDTIVECELFGVTKEESEAIIKLGYYGKVCTVENIKNLQAGNRWKASGKYGVTADLCDGPLEKWFEDKEEAIKYVVDRYEYWNGENGFGTDYGQWSLIGFTISECGIKGELIA